MNRATVMVGTDYAYGPSTSFRYLVMDRVQWAVAHEPIEHVRVVEHLRRGEFRVAWVGVDRPRIGVVDAGDLLSPWNERHAFLEGELRLAAERWAYIDEKAQTDKYLAAEASHVRSQWGNVKDQYPAGYAKAARDLLLRFGHTPPDDPSKGRWESFANSKWSGLIAKGEPIAQLIGTAVAMVLGVSRRLQTRSWIPHSRGPEVSRSPQMAEGPDALVRIAAWLTAGDGLVPVVRTWIVGTAACLVALAVIAAAS